MNEPQKPHFTPRSPVVRAAPLPPAARAVPAPPPAPTMPAALGYASVIQKPGKRRSLQWYTMGSLLALLSAGLAALILWLAIAPPTAWASNHLVVITVAPTAATVLIFRLALLIALVMVVALAVYWLVWVFMVHAEMYNFTGGEYPVSAGRAVGFCFIPFFNLYWVVAMPYQLARELETRLRWKRMRAGRVLACQVLSIFPGGLLFGLGSFCRAMVMNEIQRGLNELWRRAAGTTTSRQTSDAAAKLAAMEWE